MGFWRYTVKVTALHNRKTFFSFFQENYNNFCRVKAAQQLCSAKSWRLFASLFFIFKFGSYTMSASYAQNRERKKPNPLNFNLHSLHSRKTFVNPGFVNVVESLASWRGLDIQRGRIRADGIIRFTFLPQCYLQCSPLHLQKQKDL